MQIKQEKGHYTLYKENEAIGMAVVDGATILRLEIVPEWRGGSTFYPRAGGWCAAACPTCLLCSSAMNFWRPT